jgi:protein-disulfide isomerase
MVGGRRGQLIAGAILAAVVVVGVLVALSASGGDSDSGAARSEGSVLGVEEVRTAFQGLTQKGARLGPADAAIQIEEYADMQCPFCAQASSAYVPEIIDRFVRSGEASLTFRTMAFIGDDSGRGARAVHAAKSQNRMWDLAALLYLNQGEENDGWLSDDLIADAADALGLDRERFDADRASPLVTEAVSEDERSAAARGVTSTPSYVVTGPGGSEVVTGVQGADDIAAAIERVRQ